MTRGQFIEWLKEKDFKLVSCNHKEDTYEKNDTRYIVRIQSLGVRHRLSPNRWSGLQTWRYTERFVNAERRLDYRSKQ